MSHTKKRLKKYIAAYQSWNDWNNGIFGMELWLDGKTNGNNEQRYKDIVIWAEREIYKLEHNPIEQTIKEGKAYLRANFSKGAECPCCGRYVRLYKRAVGSVMARSLIELYKLGEGYHHVRDIIKGISVTGTNDFSKLKYWGMLKQKDNEDEKKKTSGYWSITSKGIDFVLGKIVVPKYGFVYNETFYGHPEGGPTITIVKALEGKFDYKALMRGYD